MFIKNLFQNKKEQGDTIIEVLISIAVMSLVLTVSYALANRNTEYIQQSHERSEAQKVSEQQLELLRNYLKAQTPWQTSYKCFDNSDPPQPTTSASQCNKGVMDSGVGRYGVTIVPPTSAAPDTYTVNVIWNSLTSTTQQTLAISYKLPNTQLAIQGLLPQCSDGLDNNDSEDSLVDFADPGCGSPYNPSDPDETDPPVQATVVIKKIPPGPGNTTPSCSSAATANRSGSYVSLSDGQSKYTDSNSTASFASVLKNTSYTATVSPPGGYTVCNSTAQTKTTGGVGSNTQFDFKIYPSCAPTAVYHAGYYAYGARQILLDGYYITIPPATYSYPTWNTSFVAGPPYRWYVYAGFTAPWNGQAGWYWIWDAYWVNGSYTYDGPNACTP